ncbi:MAG: ATP-binding protein [Bacteroidales bacterium]|nr:ATP-binding protein [Bacteroidales bacterium]
MLLEISVENFRSIKEMQTLSFEATKDTHLEDYYVVLIDEYRVLRAVSILGANASGKSNILKVFPLLRRLVLTSPSSKSDMIKFDPFVLDAEWKNRDSIIDVIFLCDERKYQYTITLNNKFIRREELRCKPFGAKTHTVFSRTTDDDGIMSTVKWGEKYNQSEARKLEVNMTTNTTVFAAYQRTNTDLPWMKSIIEWFENVMMPNITPGEQGLDDYTTKSILEKEVDKNQVLDLMQRADVGVDGIDVKKETKNLPKELVEMILNDDDAPEEIKQKLKESPTSNDYIVRLSHSGTLMDFDEESMGTQRYYSLSSVLLQLINKEKFVAIDELEYRLHPDLYQFFIRTFLTNKSNSQIVYTTHNREFLNDKDLFRNDSVYITEKSDRGVTELFSLADFGTDTIRNTTNILNAYKAGRLGGVPRIGSTYIKQTKCNNDGESKQ